MNFLNPNGKLNPMECDGAYDPQFLHTKFDESLIGKEVWFLSDDSWDVLIDTVKWNGKFRKVVVSGKSDNGKVFKLGNFFDADVVYYDPNHSEKYNAWKEKLYYGI